MNQMQPIAMMRMPNRIPKNPTVATLVVGLPHCEVTATKETTTVTNVEDIETYMRSKETATKKYFWAIDMPMSDRRYVINELSYMGITAGSLFPGLDEACEELKEQNFDIDQPRSL